MNRVQSLALCFFVSLLSLVVSGCSYDGPQYPTIYGPTATPTFTPAPVAVNISGSAYLPAAVTITHGNSVIWTNNDSYSHSVFPDNGAGTCATDMPIASGASITVSYPSPITIHYHCSIHNPACNATCSSSCTGIMLGTVVVK